MSAIGTKRTFQPLPGLSAIGVIEDIGANKRVSDADKGCPLFPHKQTFVSAFGMSVKGQANLNRPAPLLEC
jgi:hypothetical protein